MPSLQAAGTQLEAKYKRPMKGEGLAYHERQRFWEKYPECGEEMAVGSLEFHQHT